MWRDGGYGRLRFGALRHHPPTGSKILARSGDTSNSALRLAAVVGRVLGRIGYTYWRQPAKADDRECDHEVGDLRTDGRHRAASRGESDRRRARSYRFRQEPLQDESAPQAAKGRRGDAFDAEKVREAVAGNEAVISVL